jgi:hypothetical protein
MSRVTVRTTVTLEPDVYALLRTAMKERGVTFKEALNAAVRAGLTSKQKGRTFTQKSFSLGREQDFRWAKALEAASAVEDEELGRKLSLRKRS